MQVGTKARAYLWACEGTFLKRPEWSSGHVSAPSAEARGGSRYVSTCVPRGDWDSGHVKMVPGRIEVGSMHMSAGSRKSGKEPWSCDRRCLQRSG